MGLRDAARLAGQAPRETPTAVEAPKVIRIALA